jgi:hypothetical protein
MGAETSIASGAADAMIAGDIMVPTSLALLAYSAIIPGVWPLAAVMLEGAGLPSGVGKGAVQWAEGGEHLHEAHEALREVIEAIPEEAWSSYDHEAFKKKMDDFGTQLEGVHVFADIIMGILIIIGTVLTLYALVMLIMSIEMATFATTIYIELASVFGAVAAAPTIEAATAAATADVEALEGYHAVMSTVSGVASKVMGGAEFLFEDFQMLMGNTNMFGDVASGLFHSVEPIALSKVKEKLSELGLGKLKGVKE